MEQYSDELSFYRECGTMDSESWVSSLLDRNKSSISLEETKLYALESFKDNYENAGVLAEDSDIRTCRDAYVFAFARNATLKMKKLRKVKASREEDIQAIQEKYTVLAHVEVARWFFTVETASFIGKLQAEDVQRIAERIFKCKYASKEDEFFTEARTSFIDSFIKEAVVFLKSLEYNHGQLS